MQPYLSHPPDPADRTHLPPPEAGTTALALLKRWPEGTAMIWYPLLPEGRHLTLLGPLKRAGLEVLVERRALES